MRNWLFAALALFGVVPFSQGPARADEAALTAKFQGVVEAYVTDRALIEGLSGAALRVDRGAPYPSISVFAGGGRRF